jgi:hypothetical protein
MIFGCDVELEVGKIYTIPVLVDHDRKIHYDVRAMVLAKSTYEEYVAYCQQVCDKDSMLLACKNSYPYFHKISID